MQSAIGLSRLPFILTRIHRLYERMKIDNQILVGWKEQKWLWLPFKP